jgi:hypothetical protein
VERHVHLQTIVSVSKHYKYPIKRIGLVLVIIGHHYHLIEMELVFTMI